MQITHSDGSRSAVDPARLNAHLERACAIEPPLGAHSVDVAARGEEIVGGMVDGITTSEVLQLAERTCAARGLLHPDYLTLAARLRVMRLHKTTDARFSATFAALPRASEAAKAWVAEHAEALDAALVPERDFMLSYFGMATLERSYLIRTDDDEARILERPGHMWMRVAVGVASGGGLDEVLELYGLMSRLMMTHATPTLFNAATTLPQLSSCFLLDMHSDSIDGIYKTLSDCAKISKSAGGIGLAIHDVRAKHSAIRGTGGRSNGIVPMLRVYNETGRYVDQGGGKRKGSIAVFLEPWHADVFDFLDLRKNNGVESARCRDLFTAMWIPDLFMRRAEQDGEWSLFCPNEAPGLADVHGAEFDALYTKYEAEGKARRVVKAREVFSEILNSQVETGTPYLLYKDAANAKSNQQNLGTLRQSNLCTEILLYTDKHETGVCTLASIALPRFVHGTEFDFADLERVVAVAVKNLNRVIDVQFYPTEEARASNTRHRPIGIGIQGLHDVFQLLNVPLASAEAVQLSERIMEAMYYAAVRQSVELAKRDGAYSSFAGSPASRGELQFDLWDKSDYVHATYGRDRWQHLREQVMEHGMRNSLLIAPMPTASTSQILGCTESFEPILTNAYTRGTLAGDFFVVNARLVKALEAHGLWTDATRTALVRDRGSAQNLGLPPAVAEVYKTAWELSMKFIIDHAAARGPFVCQSQSLNLYMGVPTTGKLSSMHFYAWKRGLKTGCYYLRSRPAADAIQFSLPTSGSAASAAPAEPPAPPPAACTREAVVEEEEGCLSCGS